MGGEGEEAIAGVMKEERSQPICLVFDWGLETWKAGNVRKELCQTRAAGLVARKYCLQLDIIGSVQLLQYDKHWPQSTLDQKKEQALMWETFEQAQSQTL